MSNKILVDKGALNIALSALKRRGVNEIEQELRLSCKEYIEPLEAVRAEIENECAFEKKWAMSDFDGGTVNGLRFALEIIDKAKGVRGE